MYNASNATVIWVNLWDLTEPLGSRSGRYRPSFGSSGSPRMCLRKRRSSDSISRTDQSIRKTMQKRKERLKQGEWVCEMEKQGGLNQSRLKNSHRSPGLKGANGITWFQTPFDAGILCLRFLTNGQPTSVWNFQSYFWQTVAALKSHSKKAFSNPASRSEVSW